MKKIYQYLIRILVFLSFLIISHLFNYTSVYAYTETWYYKSGNTLSDGSCQIKTAFAGNPITPIINNIKFRQDDIYYYFDYDIEYKNQSLMINSTYKGFSGERASLFVTSLKNTWPSFDHYFYYNSNSSSNSTDIEESKGSLSFGGSTYTYHLVNKQKYYRGWLESNEYTTYETSNMIRVPTSGLKEDYYYRSPSNIRYRPSYVNGRLEMLDKGTATVTSSGRKLSDSFWDYRYTGTVKIIKEEFNSYRYLTFLSTNGISGDMELSTGSSRESGTSYGWEVRGYSIDLGEYCSCDHIWYLVNIGDKNIHERRCANCEWPIKEDHDLVFEYDGMDNNMCACGYNDKVVYTFIIEDDENGILEIPVDSYSGMPNIRAGDKRGYIFKWYELYEKHKDVSGQYDTIFIATTSEIDANTSNYSSIYKAIYEPITYTFHFSNENNMGLVFEDVINDQVFTYDSPAIISYGHEILGRTFVGWTFTRGSGEADIRAGESILNYCADDLASFILYPVYEMTRLTIRYRTFDGVFINDKQIYNVQYSYDDVVKLERPHGYYSESSFRYYIYNQEIINSFEDIKKYAVLQDMIFTLDAYFYSPPIGRSERSAEGSAPGSGIGIKGGENSPSGEELLDHNIEEFSEKSKVSIENIKNDENKKEEYSAAYEALMSYLREKYENEKAKKEQHLRYRTNIFNGKISLVTDAHPQFLTTLLYRYNSTFIIVFVVLVVGACLFLVKNDDVDEEK